MEELYVFPQDVYDDKTGTKVRREGGLGLRDYFAGQLLRFVVTYDGTEWDDGMAKKISRQCYKMADAMIAERERAGYALLAEKKK